MDEKDFDMISNEPESGNLRIKRTKKQGTDFGA